MSTGKTSKLIERILPVLLVLSIVLAFVVGILWQKVANLEGGTTNLAGQAGNAAPVQPDVNGKLSEDQSGKVAAVSSDDRIRGSQDAKVFLVEYSDLECPFCQQFHSTAQQAVDEYGGDVAWVYRHFPLDTLHPRARPAANGAECVFNLGGQDAFWGFIDEIFNNQATALSDSGLKSIAGKVGINEGEFSSCFENEKYESTVEEHYQGGLTAGVTGTPGNFIMNDKGEVWVIPGAVPYETLKLTIDEALQS